MVARKDRKFPELVIAGVCNWEDVYLRIANLFYSPVIEVTKVDFSELRDVVKTWSIPFRLR